MNILHAEMCRHLGRFCSSLVLFLIIGTCSLHIGKKCGILGYCRARHASCDKDYICRCSPQYPVQISDHECAKGRRYLEHCTHTEQCSWYDGHTYCSDTSSQSRCECDDESLFDEDRQFCKPIDESRRPYDIRLPMAVGVSVALSSMLCCFLALWRLCNRASGNRSFLSSFRSQRSNSRTPREHAAATTQESWSSDTLPSYDAAVSLKKQSSSQEDPPPPYSEAIAFQAPLSETKV